MKGVLATWPIPGKPRDTVDHIFADANETNLTTMGANLATDDAVDNYLKAEVFARSGSFNYYYGTGGTGSVVPEGSSAIFYGVEQCGSVIIRSTVGAEIAIFVEY